MSEDIQQIRLRHAERQAKIDNAARAAATGNRLAALCHGRSQEHTDRGVLLARVDELTAALAEAQKSAAAWEIQAQDLRDKLVRITTERDALVGNQGRPWGLVSVLERLAGAADHLLNDHSCDTHGHEGIGLARDEARLLLAAMRGAS